MTFINTNKSWQTVFSFRTYSLSNSTQASKGYRSFYNITLLGNRGYNLNSSFKKQVVFLNYLRLHFQNSLNKSVCIRLNISCLNYTRIINKCSYAAKRPFNIRGPSPSFLGIIPTSGFITLPIAIGMLIPVSF